MIAASAGLAATDTISNGRQVDPNRSMRALLDPLRKNNETRRKTADSEQSTPDLRRFPEKTKMMRKPFKITVLCNAHSSIFAPGRRALANN